MCFLFCYKNAPQKAQTPITQASSRTGLSTALPLPQPPSLLNFSSSSWPHQKGVLTSLTKASPWPPTCSSLGADCPFVTGFLSSTAHYSAFPTAWGTLKPLWKTRVPLSPPASLLCWPGLPGALLGLQLLTPTLPACGGFNDTRQHFHWDRFLQPCCRFSLPRL